jgi:hypothetical protein
MIDPTAGPADLATQNLVRLNPMEGTAPTGTLSLSPVGDQTRVDVRMEMAQAVGIYEGESRSGTRCDDPGGSVVDLPPISVTGGEGSGSGGLPATMRDVMDGHTLAIYRAPAQAGGQPVLCGAIPVLPPELP